MKKIYMETKSLTALCLAGALLSKSNISPFEYMVTDTETNGVDIHIGTDASVITTSELSIYNEKDIAKIIKDLHGVEVLNAFMDDYSHMQRDITIHVPVTVSSIWKEGTVSMNHGLVEATKYFNKLTGKGV